jgi:hypothetical protein
MYVNYWKVKDKIALNHKGESPYIWSFIGHFWMFEVDNKAIQLFEENECDGILYRVIRENVHGQTTNCYFVYYDGKKFHKQGYINKIGLMFEPFTMNGKQIAPALPVMAY